MSAEYIMASGNENVILCERGIRTFETYTRNTLGPSEYSCPAQTDPSSYNRGPKPRRRKMVAGGTSMAKASVAAGADGLMIEVHNNPDAPFATAPSPSSRVNTTIF